MFEASHPFAFFDYFRVPYEVSRLRASPGPSRTSAPLGRLRTLARGQNPARSLYWLRSDMIRGAHSKACQLGRYQFADFTLFGRMVLDTAVPGMLDGIGHGWRPAEPAAAGDHAVAAAWRDADGNLFLPFDPGEMMHYFWSEKYRGVGRSAVSGTIRKMSLRSSTWPGRCCRARCSCGCDGSSPGRRASRPSRPGRWKTASTTSTHGCLAW